MSNLPSTSTPRPKDGAVAAQTLVDQAQNLQQQGAIQEAIALYHQAIQIDPQSHAAHHFWGDALVLQGDLAAASAAYEQAIALNPDFFWAHHCLGMVRFWQGQFDDAIACAQRAIALNDQEAALHYQLGRTLAKLGQTEPAIAAYEQAIAYKADFVEVYAELGDLYVQQQRWSAAERCLNQVVAWEPTAERYGQFGDVLKSQERWTEAMTAYQQAIDGGIQSAQIYYNLGYVRQELGQMDGAIAAYAKALELKPDFSPAYLKIAFSPMADFQPLTPVIEALQRQLQQTPAGWLWVRLGDLLTLQKRQKEAILAYKEAARAEMSWHRPEFFAQHWARQDWAEEDWAGPNFLIIGAMKAGTTSLYAYLTEHPQVLPCIQKEVHFFTRFYSNGLNWYKAHFPPTPSGFITGEASPGYLVNNIQERIKTAFPTTKILILLRHPVERAISHYHHNFNHGLETRPFADVIAPEREAILAMGNPADFETLALARNQRQGYLFTGLYIYFIRAWIKTMGRRNVLVIKSEDLAQHPAQTMATIYDFLGLPNHELPTYPNYLPGTYGPLSPKQYRSLCTLFRPYNRKLANFLKMEFNWN